MMKSFRHDCLYDFLPILPYFAYLCIYACSHLLQIYRFFRQKYLNLQRALGFIIFLIFVTLISRMYGGNALIIFLKIHNNIDDLVYVT